MTNKYHNNIQQMCHDGGCNQYMANRLSKAVESGITDDVYDEVAKDALRASKFGVNSDKDYNIYFFINHFVDDLLKDTFKITLSPEQTQGLCKYIFDNRGNEYKLDNLTDYRVLIHKWLSNNISKRAYPNIAGRYERGPSYDLDKWVSTLKNIYNALKTKLIEKRSEAIDYFTKDWESEERSKFVNWMRYYEDGTMEKYNVKVAEIKKESDADISLPNWRPVQNKINLSTYVPPEKTKKELDMEQARVIKFKIKSRLMALRKLVDRYNDILPKQNVENIYNEIFNLEKSVSRLDVYASIQDCIFRSAGRIKKFGFIEGSEFLEKLAEGEDVIKNIPKPIDTKEPDMPPSAQKTSITEVINRLEAVSKILKTREVIRELASNDILLNDMGLASYFPELTDAQAKLIESFGYASNKIEGIIAKLRGSGSKMDGGKKDSVKTKEPLAPLPTPPSPPPAAASNPLPPKEPIETGEILSKPVEEVKKDLPKK